MDNGTKFISWSAGRIIIGIIGGIILFTIGFLQNVNSVAQDNRVEIRGVSSYMKSIDDTLKEIKIDIRELQR